MPFFGAFGAAWGDAIVARWSVNPLGMAAFVASGGNGGGPPSVARTPAVIVVGG